MSTANSRRQTGARAARKAHEWLVEESALFSNVIEQAGRYDAKVDSEANSSLAAHILNAVTVGVNTFVYQAVGPDENVEDYEEEIRVLAAALTLHDANKYVREAYGCEADGNTEDVLDMYFEDDDFGIESFLDGDYFDDLLYLVQNTEIRENSAESRGTDTEFRGLDRYSRIGDQVASVALRDGIDGAYRKLCEKVDESEVHLVEFTELEQPVLNELLLGSAKEAIHGEVDGRSWGVVIGSTSDRVLYLGTPVDQDRLREQISDQITDRIHNFNFSCKLGWNSFEYDVLDELSLPLDLKKQTIADQAEELLLTDAGGTESMESVPDEFRKYLPVLIKSIYQDGRKEYPTSELTNAYNSVYDSIEGGKSTKGQKVKIQFLQYICLEYKLLKEDLEILKEKVEPELEADLKAEGDAIAKVIDRFCGKMEPPTLGSKSNMCFVCGKETDRPYKKGHETIYQAQGFSRRLAPHKGPKQICPTCDLEYTLLYDICERSGVNLNRQRPGCRNLGVDIAYFYFDDFLGDIRVRRRRMGVPINDILDMDDRDPSIDLVKPQYYVQPISHGDHSGMSDKNHRLWIIRRLMEAARDAGMKVVVGRPFARFDSADAVFADQEATRPQELLGLDEVERYGPLPGFVDGENHSHLERALSLFRIMSIVGQDSGMRNPYIQLDRDTFHTIANFAVVNHDHATRIDELRSYFETYHERALMNMTTVAERGVDLFGKQYDSKYKKTKIFREALDAFLSGMNQRMDDERLVEYVESQVYAAADREDYAGYVEPEEAETFVDAIKTYLVENDLYELKKLSDWEDALVNSYYYAYDQVLYDQQ